MLTLAVHSKDHAKLSIELDERTKKGENPISVLDDYFKNIPALSEYRQFVLEMLFCRIVDNFLTYISEIITLIYTQNPKSTRRILTNLQIQKRSNPKFLLGTTILVI